MRNEYLRILQTPSVERAQLENYGRAMEIPSSVGGIRPLGRDERAYIEARDSFYMASVSESGWPYLQHRGGALGFLRVIDERRLAFADQEGNRQLISAGNLAGDDRVSLFLMDYRARERLKVLGHGRVASPEKEPEIAATLGLGEDTRARRIFIVEVVGYDWNCPKFITQRFARDEVEEALLPYRKRIEELEAELGKRG